MRLAKIAHRAGVLTGSALVWAGSKLLGMRAADPGALEDDDPDGEVYPVELSERARAMAAPAPAPPPPAPAPAAPLAGSLAARAAAARGA